MSAAPFEILAGPVEIYLAPCGTAFPDIDATPGSPWSLLGTSGADNYDEDGVSISHPQTLEEWRGLGKTGPLKVFRTEEGLEVGLTVVDLTAEHYATLINDAAVTDVAGSPGYRHFSLLRGTDVALFALLLRGEMSPYGSGLNIQYEIPKVYEGGEPEPTFTKGEPAGLEVSFMALQDQTDGFGTYNAQDAV